MNSLKRNLAYNVCYQLLIIILPFVTAPYVSRAIGANSIGVYSYTYAVANYFMLFGMLGINNHGSRSIASCKDDPDKLGKCFVNNYAIQLFTGLLSAVLYVFYVVFFTSSNKVYSLIQVLVVLSGVLDINWFFWGLERFRLTVVRSTICKIISVICIFIFVRSSEDLWVYVLIMSLTIFVNQLITWKYLFIEISIPKPEFSLMWSNLKSIIILYLPILSYSVYRMMDKIMIGNYSSMVQLGYYENAEKIVNVPIGIITALGNVMIPRISNLVSKGDKYLQFRYIDISFQFVSIVEGSLCFGISAVAIIFSVLFFGQDFLTSGEILEIIIFTALISGWANIIRTQYLIPMKKDRIYVISMISAAIINCFLNLIFIPRFGAMGAVIGTVCAELAVLLIQAFAVRKDICLCSLFRNNIAYLLIGFLMYLSVKLVNHKLTDICLSNLIIEVSVGVFVYSFLLVLYIRFFQKSLYAVIANSANMLINRMKGILLK